MRRYNLLDSLNSVETLELKVSATVLSVGGLAGAPALSNFVALAADDDHTPDAEPPPPPYTGDNPPIQYPTLPPSGPIGPG
jgi:hypothetical protein